PELTINGLVTSMACPGDALQIDPGVNWAGGVPIYDWVYQGQTVSTGSVYNVPVVQAGLDSVQLTVSDTAGICPVTQTFYIMGEMLPVARLLTQPVCAASAQTYEFRISTNANFIRTSIDTALITADPIAGEYTISNIPLGQVLSLFISNQNDADACEEEIIFQPPLTCDCSSRTIPDATTGTKTLKVCGTDNLQELNIDALPSGFTAEWFSGPDDVSPFLSDVLKYSPTSSDTVYVKVREDVSGCLSNSSLALSLEVNDPPKITYPNDTLACAGIAFEITPRISGSGSYQYSWSATGMDLSDTRDSSISIVVEKEESLQLKVTDGNNCTDSIPIKVGLRDLPEVILYTLVPLNCFGDDFGIIAATPLFGGQPFTYEWSTGDRDVNFIDSLEAGDYTIRIYDRYGCTNTDTFTLSTPPPIEVTIVDTSNIKVEEDTTFVGAIEVKASGGTPPYKLTWRDEDGVPQGAGLRFETSEEGFYSLTVVDSMGCVWTSDALRIEQIVTSIEDLFQLSGISVYPNPAVDYLQIETSNQLKGDIQLTVLNNLGAQMTREVISAPTIQQIETKQWPSGQYWLHFRNGDKIYTTKIIKQ
ncbi:MAG: T9SS type A sorting domain-containing protein, partial [Bacteroidota bacterium]